MEYAIGFIILAIAAAAYYRVDRLVRELKRRNILEQDFSSED